MIHFTYDENISIHDKPYIALFFTIDKGNTRPNDYRPQSGHPVHIFDYFVYGKRR